MEKKQTGAKETMKKISGCIFVGAILLVLVLGFVQTVFFPVEMTAYENRYANKIAPFTMEGYMDGSFQESVDTALGDQVTLADQFKKVFQEGSSYSLRLLSKPIINLEYFKTHYFGLGYSRIFGGTNLVYGTYPESRTAELDVKIEDYNQVFERFPETDFYMYYIEKETDLNLETNKKVNFYEYIRDRLDLPKERMRCFTVNNFEEFRTYFYKTDHHWNHVGSYKGYTEVAELLGVDEELLKPQETAKLSDSFSGSKATSYFSTYSEEFIAHRFEFPEMTVQVNSAPAVDYGQQDGFFSHQATDPTYGAFYGWDFGEIIFSTNRPEKKSILVIGESYDNAILKLLASHYDCTYSIDLRYYEPTMQKPFSLSAYLDEHEIDQVLLIGNIDYYLMSEFMLGE